MTKRNAFGGVWPFALAVVFAGDALAVRGSFEPSEPPEKYYPGPDWQPTKAFMSLYDFGFKSNSSVQIYGGFSSAGNGAQGAACSHGGKGLCATPTSSKHDGPCDGAKDLPMMFPNGQTDYGDHAVTMAQTCNSQGMRQSVVWGRNEGHIYQDPALAFIFYAECLRLRYPPGATSLRNTPRNKGWLGDMDQSASWDTDCPYIGHAEKYGRDKNKAAWLPTRYFAFCWRATVVGDRTSTACPIAITSPYRAKRWEGWPEYKAGDNVSITASYPQGKPDRVDICYGDNVIVSLPASPLNIYKAQWKAVAGIHGILVVAYKNDLPIGVSHMVPVIVSGKVDYPPVDLDDTNLIPPSKGTGIASPQPGTSSPLTVYRTSGVSRFTYLRLYGVDGTTLCPTDRKVSMRVLVNPDGHRQLSSGGMIDKNNLLPGLR